MLNRLCFMVIIAILAMPSLAQESSLPFAYISETSAGITLHIVDALSLEESYQLEDSCPIAFSPDRQRFLFAPYSPFISEIHSLNLQTSETTLISADAYLEQWSSDSQRFAYRYETSEGNSLMVYDFASQTSTLVYTGNFSVQSFQGGFLYYFRIEGSLLSLHRWNDGDEALASLSTGLELDASYRLTLSPNRQFLAIEGEDSSWLNLFDLTKGEQLPFGDIQPIQWQPKQAATLAYSWVNHTSLIEMQTDLQTDILGATGGTLAWSPDGSYLVEIDTEDLRTFRILAPTTGDIFELGQYELWEYPSYEWLSTSQIIYMPPRSEVESQDFFFYDLVTSEQYQITDSPDSYVSLGCPVG